MTKDKKGITIVSLVITVIVMLIILGVTMISGSTLLSRSKLTKIEMFMMMVKTKAEAVIDETEFNTYVSSEELTSGHGWGDSTGGFADDATQIYTIDENHSEVVNYEKLIKFSRLEELNKSPTCYNYKIIRTFGDTVFTDKYNHAYPDYEAMSQYMGEENLSRMFYTYSNNTKRMMINRNGEFENLIKTIYPVDEYDWVRTVISSTNGPCKGFDYDKSSYACQGVMDKFFFVKWGLDECVSEGIISATRDPSDGTITYNGKTTRIDSSLVDNNNKYFIVVYDLKDFKVVSVAYSLGYRTPDKKLLYTLDDMLKIDQDGE